MEKKHSEKEKTSLDSPSPKLNKSMIAYHETGDLFADTCEIVESAQSIAYAAVDTILVQRNWLLGKRIAIECLNENGKADYGKKTMKKLSTELKEKYGYEVMLDGACSPERVETLSKVGVKGFILGTSALFGKEKSYKEIVKELRSL